MDLMVVLPRKESHSLLLDELLNRLVTVGYNKIALTHTVFGSPRQIEDRADSVIKQDIVQQQCKNNKAKLQIVRRLHAVIENLSDVGHFVNQNKQTPTSTILDGYDLVSIAPRNDAVFQATCASATATEIINLDYTTAAGRGGLPFKIRATDVKAAVSRNVVFEIPYAAGVLNPNQRKALVQTCRELQTACQGLKPKIIFSSGGRVVGDSDVGSMSLRMPGDLANLQHAVLGFDTKMATDTLTTHCAFALEQGRKRRFGDSIVVHVHLEDVDVYAPASWAGTDDFDSKKRKLNAKGEAKLDRTDKGQEKDQQSEKAVEDGFISF
jgi:RNase P/RNase MRP subunit p30